MVGRRDSRKVAELTEKDFFTLLGKLEQLETKLRDLEFRFVDKRAEEWDRSDCERTEPLFTSRFLP